MRGLKDVTGLRRALFAFTTGLLLVATGAAEVQPWPDEAGQLDLARRDPAAYYRLVLERHRRQVRDYRCSITKLDRRDGELQAEERMDVWVRYRPHSVAMRWTEVGDSPLDTLLYVAGQNDGRILIHPSGLIGKVVKRVTRDPSDPEVQQRSTLGIDRFGFANSLQSGLDAIVAAQRAGELRSEVEGPVVHRGKRCLKLTRTIPAREGVRFPTLSTWFDLASGIPVSYEGRSPDGQLVARYHFDRLQLNAGLGDEVFAPGTYGF